MEQKTSKLTVVLVGLALLALIVVGVLLLKGGSPTTSPGAGQTRGVSSSPGTGAGGSLTVPTSASRSSSVATTRPKAAGGKTPGTAAPAAGTNATSSPAAAALSASVRAAFVDGRVVQVGKVPATGIMSRAVMLTNQLALTDEQRVKIEKFNKQFAEQDLQPSFDKLAEQMDDVWKDVEQARTSGDQAAIQSVEEKYANLVLQRKTMAMDVEHSYLNKVMKYLSPRQYKALAKNLGTPMEGLPDADFPPGYKLPD